MCPPWDQGNGSTAILQKRIGEKGLLNLKYAEGSESLGKVLFENGSRFTGFVSRRAASRR